MSNLAAKCATHGGTQAVGQTDGHGAITGIPYVELGPRVVVFAHGVGRRRHMTVP